MNGLRKSSKKVLIIIGSASNDSSNHKLMETFRKLTANELESHTAVDLSLLPHFNPSKTECLPEQVEVLLNAISASDAVVICSPEYIFSIPARVKNLLEWCVATTVFSEKPVGIIIASADGREGHAQMHLLLKTLGARLSDDASLIISGIKGRFDPESNTFQSDVVSKLRRFADGLKALIASQGS
ncbi:NADPH-dependent FMN reductase [Pedobacter sp. JY14-1]|uniref:NADPH-dependent FMN reductase n=1 Tax=Pedobacter sp. JY14-1 TaxID=3034151 RepID=UPI0023E14580|nr:NADPH-dependent FMN reductase [Pedobacter sp. JY14-1]